MFLVILNWILASRRSDLTSGNSSFVWLEWEPVVVNEVFRLAGADAVGTVKCPSLACWLDLALAPQSVPPRV